MTAQPTTIERATLEDASTVAQLHFLSHTVSFPLFASEEWVNTRHLDEYVANWQATLSSATSDDQTLIARIAGKAVGIVRVASIARSDSHDYDAQLTSMHVDPELTGSGIGTLLMTHALDFIHKKGFSNVQLGVIAANTGGRHFYEAHGWVLVEEFPDGIEGVPIVIYRLA